jgi:Predicted phosphatases
MADFGAIRALAFDLDGTLVDSAPGLAAAIDMALEERGLPQAGEERVGTWIGNGADVLVQRALRWAEAEGTPEQCGRLRERFDHFYAQTVDSGSRLFPQVQETLARLAAHGYPMALVTNKPTPFVAPLLASLGIGDYFSLVIGGDDVTEKNLIRRRCTWCSASLGCVHMNCCSSAIRATIFKPRRAPVARASALPTVITTANRSP